MIYADNAATTQLAPEALAAMMPYLQTEYGNASQPYSFSKSAKKALMDARKLIAQCINAFPEEIFFTSGGTESDNWAIKESMFSNVIQGTFVTSQVEHHAVLHSASALQRLGYTALYLPVDELGVLRPHTLEQNIPDNTKLVSVMFANNEVGSIEPIKELATIAHNHGALFHTDAVQAVGHVSIDVKDLGVDMLSASAHKFNGPKGIGFLYVKDGCDIFPYVDGGAQEYGMRAGTENIPAIVGMAKSLELSINTLSDNEKKLLNLEKTLTDRLDAAGIDYRKNGADIRIPGNMSLSFKNFEGEMLLHRLDLKGICVSTGSACDSKNTQISHVLSAMQVPNEYAIGTIRISFGRYNSEEDAIKIAESLVKIISKKRD